jgi:Ni,Fe-hydrogenase III large subunit
MSKLLKYDAVTGIFLLERTKNIYSFTQRSTSVCMTLEDKLTKEDTYTNPVYPLSLLRHSFGLSGGDTEDYSILSEYADMDDRERELSVALNSNNTLKNLDYRGMKLPIDSNSYSHVVGPIHAGIIEPGHFRFYVSGEIIKKLHIRLGYQKRGVYALLKNKSPIQTMPISESIASDSTVSYSTAFANIYEQSMNLEVSNSVKLFRMVLLELERMAIHIGDLGAIAGDIGYYPLLGVCSTDRGVPLTALETLTGSRFAKGCIYPGEVRPNRKLSKPDLLTTADRLKETFIRVEKQVLRALDSTTIRERLHGCGEISRNQVYRNGFLGMAARCTGIVQDLRLSQELYHQTGMTLWLEDHREDLLGDAWSRFYLRYIELKNSCEWVTKMLHTLEIPKVTQRPSCIDHKEYVPGVYFSSVEGWRGPVLVSLDIGSDGKILQAYIRDPSVLNWHALELAIQGELVGDFPLNNKSFNLSYVGVDL